MHCKSYSHFFSKKIQHICISLDVNFNKSLTNDVVSFEQLGPGLNRCVKLFLQPVRLRELYIKMRSWNPCLFNLYFTCFYLLRFQVQSNLNSSNTDGSFTMANSNSFLSPYKILPLAQENKYLGKFSYFIMKLYVVYTH